MERHVFPIIGDTPVTEIDRPTVLDALKPIWFDLPDAARRIRLRIRETLDYAVDLGLIEVNAERLISKVALPPQPKVKEHRKALLHGEVAGALDCVRESPAWDSTKLCFEWMVLTASRPQEALLVQWNEIDLDARTWTVPAAKMKARRGHRQPLSEQPWTCYGGRGNSTGRPMIPTIGRLHRQRTGTYSRTLPSAGRCPSRHWRAAARNVGWIVRRTDSGPVSGIGQRKCQGPAVTRLNYR